jgi:hypothetical protein
MRFAPHHRQLLHDARADRPGGGVATATALEEADGEVCPPGGAADADAGAAGAPQEHAPSRSDRARVALRHAQLDRRLAAGEPSAGDRAMTVRAWQLTRPRMRRQLADSLERVVHDCDGAQPAEGAAGGARHAEVRVARGEMLWLAARLRDGRPVSAHGVALVLRLLSDGASPLYADAPRHALWRAVHEATDALD